MGTDSNDNPPLSYQYFGQEGKEPLVILHGLLGSSRNWKSVGTQLSEHYEVFSLDLRNHGTSFHHDEMDYPKMVDDVFKWVRTQKLNSFSLMGHSMGGKVAMSFACRYSSLVNSLFIADIAPKGYPPHHQDTFEILKNIDLSLHSSRKTIDEELSSYIADWGFRQFLLTNVKRSENKGFEWQIDFTSIYNNLPKLCINCLEADERYLGPTMFIRGGNSDFVLDSDREAIYTHFPKNVIETLPNIGHNVHVESPKEYLNKVLNLNNVDWGCEI